MTTNKLKFLNLMFDGCLELAERWTLKSMNKKNQHWIFSCSTTDGLNLKICWKVGPNGVYCILRFCGGGVAENIATGRPVYWMRYVDWFFTTPFFLLDLALLAGADAWDTFYVMLMNAICTHLKKSLAIYTSGPGITSCLVPHSNDELQKCFDFRRQMKTIILHENSMI